MEIDQKLDLILEILGEHSQKLDEQDRKLDEHGRKLDEHSRMLDEHSQMLNEQGRKLDEQSRILGIHGQKHSEHNELLRALIHGQQEIKADLDGFKVETFKRFDDVNEKLDSFESKQDELGAKVELLEKRTWTMNQISIASKI